MKRNFYRGFSVYQNKWVYGVHVKLTNTAGRAKHCIIPMDTKDTSRVKEPIKYIYVKSGSVAQSTGIVDKNGTEIYENDWLVMKPLPNIEYIGKVKWNAKLGCWSIDGYTASYYFLTYNIGAIAEVVEEKDLKKVQKKYRELKAKEKTYNTVWHNERNNDR